MYKVTVGPDEILICDIKNVQAAILSFINAVVAGRSNPHATVGFKLEEDGVIYGYLAETPEQVQLKAKLYGVTHLQWEAFGPPSSLELSDEEVDKRGLTGVLAGKGKSST